MQESFASFWLSRVAIAAVVVYASSAVRLWRLAPDVLANRIAALLCADLAVWALQAAVSYAADDPAITVALTKAMSWSWPFFPALAFHLAIELNLEKGKRPVAIRALVSSGYAAALFFSYLLAGPLLRGAVRRAGYWSVDITPGLGYSAFSAFYLILNLAGILLVARACLRSQSRRARTMLGIIVATHAVALAGGFTTDTILEALGVDFPKVGVLWAGVWAIGLNYAMERYGFLAPFSPRDTGLLMDRFIERSMDGIAVSDSAGRVIYWNEPLALDTGIPVREAVGKPLARIREALSPPGRPELDPASELFTAARSPGGERRGLVDLEIVHKDGRPRWLQTSAFTIPSGEGDIRAFIMRDVTLERQAAEKALERLRRQGHAQKMEALGCLAGGIAHDFNNTLGGIVGAVSLIEASMSECSRPPDITRELSVIKRSVKRAAGAVRGLMAFVEDAPHRHEPFRLNESAARVVELAKRTLSRGASIEAPDLPPDAFVVGDAPQVEQLILNLVINAEHAMTIMRPTGDAKGGVIRLAIERIGRGEASIAAHPDAAGAGHWALSVSDEGVGIDRPTLAKIFDPFFSTKDPEHGSGLGLSMVHLIARQHEGFVEVDSRPGVGSTFTVYLPIADVERVS